MISAREALERLQEGNRRFVSDVRSHDSLASEARRAEVVGRPGAVRDLLGCSDSRVPAEIVFNQGLGDLFVIRVAGNIVAPSQVGSVEFAAGKFGTRLVVVLGHSNCGAIPATLDELDAPRAQTNSINVRWIVDRIRPLCRRRCSPRAWGSGQSPIRWCTMPSARTCGCRSPSCGTARMSSSSSLVPTASPSSARGSSLETGVVEFFDGV